MAGRPYRGGMTSPTDPRSFDEGGGPVWAEAYGDATYGQPLDRSTSGVSYQYHEESAGRFGAPPPTSAPPPPPRTAPPPRPGPPPGYGYPPPGPARPTRSDCSDAALGHYLGAIGILGPLIVFLTHNSRMSRWMRLSLHEALNFQISVMIYNLVLGAVISVIALITCGIGVVLVFLLVVPWVLTVIYSVLGGQAASRGELYEYPVTIRFLK